MSRLSPLTICRWLDTSDPASRVPGIEAVFFETAGTQTFPDDTARSVFRERWLGRFLTHYPEHVWLALAPSGAVAGYLAGCLDNPTRTERFSDIAYFADLASLTSLYPAHLHINLTAAWRGGGAGSRLIEAFAADVAARGAPGLHVVTGAHMRNVGFYLRNGLVEVARFRWPSSDADGRELVMLGRRLAPGAAAL